MTVVELEQWRDKRGIAEFFAVSIRTVEYWTARGMPSRIHAGKRVYQPSKCDPWVERYGKKAA